MHSLNPLNSFVGGEWSPNMDSRYDLPGYRKAARLMRNLIPLKQGGCTRRPGTQYIATGLNPVHSLNTYLSRLQKFQYAPGTSFILEFVDKGIRFYSNGAQIQATGVTPWVSGSTYPAGAFVTDGTHGTYYALVPIVSGLTNAPHTSPGSWNPQTYYEVPTPYSGTNFTQVNGNPDYQTSDVFVLQCKQINDVVYVVHPNFPVYKLIRYSDTNWVFAIVNFLTPAMLDQNATDTTLTAGATSGTGVSLQAAAPSWSSANYYIPGNSVEFSQSGGSFGIGITYTITSVGSTDFTLIGASANTVGVIFTATGVGAGTVTASGIYN